MEISGSASLAPPALYSLFRPVPRYARSFESSLDRNRGILNTITRIALSFLPRRQQQRKNQSPNPISAAASANHQKDDGKTRDSRIISPSTIASIPRRQ